MSFTGLFNHTVDVIRPVVAQNATGATVKTNSSLLSDVPCTVQTNGVNAVDAYGRPVHINTVDLFCSRNSDTLQIESTDIVVFNGIEYRITGINDAAGRGHHLEISMIELV